MAYWVDLKYLKLLPLQQFTPVGNGKFNFRCPVCGDSQKSKTKKRGWAITYENTIIFKCFNCDMPPMHISAFLKNYHPDLYKDYLRESFVESGSFKKKIKKEKPFDLFAQTYDTLNLQLISELPTNHKAVEFLKNRLITAEMYSSFYYTDDFYKWAQENIDSKFFDFQHHGDKRIVIPFFDKYNKIFAVQGRTIEYDQAKYITIKTVKSEHKIYGLNKVDFTKIVHVVEGPFDSLFLNNCLAMGGSLSNLDTLLKLTPKTNIVVVPDNDKRNKQTKKLIESALEKGYKTVIWPNNISFKDINEAVIQGFTKEKIYDIIAKNTFSGLMGIAKLKMKGNF